MDERSAGVLSSSTVAAACQIASTLAGGDEGTRAEAVSTSFSSKVSETAVADCLFSVSRGFSNFAGLLLAVGCLAGFLVAAGAEVLYMRSESVNARGGSGATVSCSECRPYCKNLATAHAVWL